MNYGFLVSDFMIMKDHPHAVANVGVTTEISKIARMRLTFDALRRFFARGLRR